MKCLFLVGNNNQARMMSRVASRLRVLDRSCAVAALTLEPYLLENAPSVLNEADVPFNSLADYPGKRPVGILQELTPDVLVVGHDNTIITRPFVEAAKYLGIPSVLVQDGVIARASLSVRRGITQMLGYLSQLTIWQRNYRFLWASLRDTGYSLRGTVVFVIKDLLSKLAYSSLYGRGGCTRIAVFGDYFKELFVGHGVPAERIVVTGHPMMDTILTCNEDKTMIRRKLGLPLDKAIVLLLTTAAVEYNLWRPGQRHYFIAQVLKAFTELPKHQLAIKLHPREKVEDYQKLVQDLGFEVPIYKDVNLYEILNAADAAITTYSTTGLDALILKKPLIVFELFSKVEPVPYVGSGAALGVYRPQDLRAAIMTVFNDDETKRQLKNTSSDFVYHYAYKLDGKAAERVAELIVEVSRENSVRRDSLST
jgi:hypothetical protein